MDGAGTGERPPRFPSIYFFGFSATLPPFLAQSAADISTTPLPLHPFLPAHEFSAVAQLPCPLQALTPAQFAISPPFFPSSARAVRAPAMMRLAAALAISIPLFTRIRSSLVAVSPTVRAAHQPRTAPVDRAYGAARRSGSPRGAALEHGGHAIVTSVGVQSLCLSGVIGPPR